MNVQNQCVLQNSRNAVTVRDVLVAKAIQSGYNPYCRSTDTNARKVTDAMRARVQGISVPKAAAMPVVKKQAAVVRELKASAVKREPVAYREVIAIENFELVRRKAPALSLGMIVSVMVTAMVLAMVVFSGSLINEEARRYTELSGTLEILREENETLSLALEEKNDLVVIEDAAKNELGMVKIAEAQQRYVSLTNGDSIQTYVSRDEEASATLHMLNAFGEKSATF